MTSLVKKEVYTTSRPDGTLVMTTTKTTTKTEQVDQFGLDSEFKLNSHYCCTPGAIITGLTIICLVTSVFGTGPFIGLLFGQTFLLILTSVSICLTCIILVAIFLTFHTRQLSFWPWRSTCLLFGVIAGCCFILCGFLEAYYATGAWANNCNSIGGDGVVHSRCRIIVQWAFASAFCFLLAFLYFVSAFFAHKGKYFA